MADGRPPRHDAAAAREELAEKLHDVRTPLTVVIGRVQLMRRRLQRGRVPENLDDELAEIEAAAKRLAEALARLDPDANRS